MATQPRLYVDNPPTFTPLPFGLLTSLSGQIRNPPNTHWQLGINYEPICGAGGTTYEKCFTVTGSGLNPVGPPPSKADTGGKDARGATAFTVFAEVDCSPVGFWDDAENIVAQLLTQSEQWQVERAFATGIAGGQPTVYPHLAANATLLDGNVTLQPAAVVVTGGPMDIVEGVGKLENAIAQCYDGVPTLHVPLSLGPAMATNNLLIREGSHYRTPSGSFIILGAGYPGTAPDGTLPADSRYVYATGAMMIYRSRPRVIPARQSIDRAENTVKAIAERAYLVAWDCCLFAVNISLGGVPTGTVNA